MRKILILIGVFASVTVFANKNEIFGGWSFFAPTVDNEQNYNVLEAGDIVYEENLSGPGKFYGKTAAGNSWIEFGGTAPSDMVTSPGQSNPVLVSALITDGSSTTVVSEEDEDFINGNCTNPSDVGVYTCTFNTTYWNGTPHCWTQPVSSAYIIGTPTRGSSSYTFNVFDADGNAIDVTFMLFCKGEKN